MAVEETRIVTKRLHEFTDDSWTIDRYLATGGYEQLRRALTDGARATSRTSR